MLPFWLARPRAAQNAQWTATSSPIQATIAGGPWTLGQGGVSHQAGGAYDGPIPYCTPGNSGGGTELMNPTGVVNTFNPYYFPFVVGSGQNVKGYFDYRPKDINEAVVEAISTNAGQTWTFQQMAEQLTTECPNSDSNTANDRRAAIPPATITAKAIRASSAMAAQRFSTHLTASMVTWIPTA